MGFPSEGKEALCVNLARCNCSVSLLSPPYHRYRNPMPEVRRFLSLRHGLQNCRCLCSRTSYQLLSVQIIPHVAGYTICAPSAPTTRSRCPNSHPQRHAKPLTFPVQFESAEIVTIPFDDHTAPNFQQVEPLFTATKQTEFMYNTCSRRLTSAATAISGTASRRPSQR